MIETVTKVINTFGNNENTEQLGKKSHIGQREAPGKAVMSKKLGVTRKLSSGHQQLRPDFHAKHAAVDLAIVIGEIAVNGQHVRKRSLQLVEVCQQAEEMRDLVLFRCGWQKYAKRYIHAMISGIGVITQASLCAEVNIADAALAIRTFSRENIQRHSADDVHAGAAHRCIGPQIVGSGK